MRITVNNRYIKTKIGFLPIEWEIETLENICIKKGLIRGPFGGALKKEYFKEQGVKVYEQKNAIYKDYSLGNYYINNEKFEELKRFEVSEGDFIVSCSGTIGRIYRIPKEAEKGIINQALLNIKIDTKKINSDFFYQYFQWDNFQYRIIDNTQGGAMANLVSMEQFRKTIFPIPPLKEQAKIAEILSTWDSAIEKQEQLIEKKKEFKKGLMQRLLSGEVRFKEFTDEWRKLKLGDILYEPVKEKVVNPSEYELITVKLHCNGVEKTGKFPNITENGRPYYFRNPGELLIGRQNFHNGGIAIVPEGIKNNICSNAISSFCAKDSINIDFVYYYLSRRDYYKKVEFLIGGTGQKEISKKEFNNLKISIPNYLEQCKIVDFLKTVDNEIELLKKELEALKLQKKGLMQRLLTGEVRVKV